MAGQQAAMGKYLAYTRGQEEAADAAGARYLAAAGLSGRGSAEFFHRLMILENRHGVSRSGDAAFWSTHPLTTSRISYLTDMYQRDPAWNRPADPALEAPFSRIKAKLGGYLDEPAGTLATWPQADTSLPARTARALALSRTGSTDAALAQLEPCDAPQANAWTLELAGQIMAEAGRSGDALPCLRRAYTAANEVAPSHAGLVGTTLAGALLAHDEIVPDPALRAEALAILQPLARQSPDNPEIWRLLGQVHAASGDMPRMRLARAELAAIGGDMMLARREASAARDALQDRERVAYRRLAAAILSDKER